MATVLHSGPKQIQQLQKMQISCKLGWKQTYLGEGEEEFDGRCSQENLRDQKKRKEDMMLKKEKRRELIFWAQCGLEEVQNWDNGKRAFVHMPVNKNDSKRQQIVSSTLTTPNCRIQAN